MIKLKYSPILYIVKKRVRRNQNVIIIINGPTGSAKTYCALRLAVDISKDMETNYYNKTNLDFKFPKLLRKMMLKENQKPGTPFIFEEVGAVGSGSTSREWQSQQNKFFNSFMQTSRHRRQVLIMTCPAFTNLEASTRRLVHIQMDTAGIDYNKRTAFVKPYVLQVNSRSGKIYFKYPRVRIEGKKIKVSKLGLLHPPQDIADEYEAMKTKFTTELNNKIMEPEKVKIKRKRPGVINLNIVRRYMEMGLKTSEMAVLIGVDPSTVRGYKRKLKAGKNEPNLDIHREKQVIRKQVPIILTH